jgi:hypothetical protein
MTLEDRIDALAGFFASSCAGGLSTFSADDVLDDGTTTAREELFGILGAVRSGGTYPSRQARMLEAFEVMGDVWESGFDLASAADTTDDGMSVGEILESHVAPAGPTPAA